jgi:succinylglutamic semialdehyde dehydrogenase
MLDHFINGQWIRGQGEAFSSINPATGDQVLQTRNANPSEVAAAFEAAGAAFQKWAESSPPERFQVARRFATIVEARRQEFVTAISSETGKPFWESNQEIDTVTKKIDLSISAYEERTGNREQQTGSANAVLSHAPHGIVAILGPFNFPAHLPNGHIVPALIAGNCAVFKPSELTPLTGALMADCWQRAGLPVGCLNLLQGDRRTAELILEQPELSGVLFTGSATTGVAIHQRFAGRPHVILALEMGGNNPIVVLDTYDPVAAARIVAVSAFISAGQRCSCTRRLILVSGSRDSDDLLGNPVLDALGMITQKIVVGPADRALEPFIGPVINVSAAKKILNTQEELIAKGAKALVKSRPTATGLPFLQPGILDMTNVEDPPDEEVFGPLLQVYRVGDLDRAILLANKTGFGLAAGLIGGTAEEFYLFRRRVRAGIINWNRPTTGASSAAPFGGVGLSGNHRPSAFYAADYCAYPVATIQSEQVSPIEYPGLAP